MSEWLHEIALEKLSCCDRPGPFITNQEYDMERYPLRHTGDVVFTGHCENCRTQFEITGVVDFQIKNVE